MDVVKEICTKAAVMEHGKLVECGPVFDIFARPQKEITKNFLMSATSLRKIDDLLQDNPGFIKLKPGQKLVRLTFLERSVSQPLLASLAAEFQVLANILYADLEYLQESPVGGTVVILDGKPEKISQSLDWLQSQNIETEVLQSA